ncbi:MAG: hypothetical protein IT464_02490 [Planctomycetes bacterium]|nr:hypothetical protein [Planctomycetota bacterium]
MADQVLKAKNGKVLGKIKSGANGQLVAFSANGKRLGRYETRNDTTYNANGGAMGKGNQLAALIFAASQD